MRGSKKVFKKNWAVMLLVMAMVAALTGCGSSMDSAKNQMSEAAADYGSYSYATTESAMDAGGFSAASAASVAEAAEPAAGTGTQESYANADLGERKLIRTVDLDVETQEYDNLLSAVENQVKALGGYIEHINTYNGGYYSYGATRSADMTIRIPKDNADAFLDTLSGISNITRRSENVEDVTLTYVDLESRREALDIEQERLLALLEKAESVEDMITIEERLSEVRYQLESMESQLRTYDNQVDYSTVYLNISEVEVYTPVEEDTVWERISAGFAESLHNIGEGFVDFGVWFVVNLPYMIVWAVIIVVVVLLCCGVIKLLKKNGSDRKSKKQELPKNKQQEQEKKNGGDS